MNVWTYLKEKTLFLCFNLFVAGFSAFLLYVASASIYFMLFTPCIYLAGSVFSLLPEYFRKKNYYSNLQATLDTLDKKYLLSEIIEQPNFAEGVINYETLKTVSKAMNDEISKYARLSAAYREYIELWVHEIKTPIAGGKLICENTDNTRLLAEFEEIDKYVEQALFLFTQQQCREGLHY